MFAKCSLEEKYNKCEFFDKKTRQCKRSIPCSLVETKEVEKKKEKWYEKYYKYSKTFILII